jgi:hypothetical protein
MLPTIAETLSVDPTKLGKELDHIVPAMMQKQRYFKYLSGLAAIISALNGRLKFTRIHDLNDPSEMFPVVDRIQLLTSLKQLRQLGYLETQMEGLRRQGALLSRLAPDHMRVEIPTSQAEATALVRSSFF